MAFIKKYYGWIIFGGAIALLPFAMTPAGRDRLAPNSSAMAMRGINLYSIMIQSYLTDLNRLEKASDSTRFFREILKEEDRYLAFDREGCIWTVAATIPDEANDMFPVMISANFNPELMAGGVRIDPAAQLPIGVKSGADRSLLDDRAIVVVRRNGTARVIKAKDLKLDAVSSGVGISAVEYLTPTKRVRVSIPMEYSWRRIDGRCCGGGPRWRSSCTPP